MEQDRDKAKEVAEAVRELRAEEAGLRMTLGGESGQPLLSHSWSGGRPHFLERLDRLSGAEVAEEIVQARARLAELELARPYLDALVERVRFDR